MVKVDLSNFGDKIVKKVPYRRLATFSLTAIR